MIAALEVIRDRLAFLQRLRETCGDNARFRIGRQKFVLITRAEDVHFVLGSSAFRHSKGVGLADARAVLGTGLLTAEEDVWSDHHAMLASLFQKPRLACAVAAAEELIEEHIAEWFSRRRIDIVEELSIVALRVAARALLDEDVLHPRAVVRQFAHLERRAISSMVLGLIVGHRHRARLANALVRPVRKALLTMLQPLQPQRTAVARLLAGRPAGEVEDELLTLLFAGHDTTAAAMASVVDEITARPDLHAAIAAEQDRGDEMSLLASVIDEALRLHPPVWLIPRVTRSAESLPTCDVEPDTQVLISPYLLHRDVRLWSDADRFLPERFSRPIPPGAPYFPFGAGPRRCIGSAMAMSEMRVVLSAIFKRRIRRCSPTTRYKALLTLRPRSLACEFA